MTERPENMPPHPEHVPATAMPVLLQHALLKGDDDQVAAILAVEEAHAWAVEGFTWCATHACVYHYFDGCRWCQP